MIIRCAVKLSYRAGISFSWQSLQKKDFLTALTHELSSPGDGAFDSCLLEHKGPRVNRGRWGEIIKSIQGLGGLDENNKVEGNLSDGYLTEKIQQFKNKRDYHYKINEDECSKCMSVPCICSKSDATSSQP